MTEPEAEGFPFPYAFRDASPEQHERWVRRGATDAVADLVEDGIERRPAVNRWEGGDTDRRVLEYRDGAVEVDGRFLRITIELVPLPEEPPPP